MAKKGERLSEEIRRKMSLAKMGNKSRLGMPHSEETKKKIGAKSKGRIPSKETRLKMSLAKKGKHMSPETEFKKGGIPQWIRDRATANLRRGERHWNWKSGIAKERDLIKISPEYKQWIQSVFERDNYTCVRCLKHGGNLCAHHIIPFSVAPEERFEMDNGATLCIPCHYFIHSKELVVNQHV